MIDLHIHSKYSSDGIEEVYEILEQAENLKLTCISITDHNSCNAYNDLKNENTRRKYSGDIITGVELNTKMLGIPIEILGYNINPEKMQDLIDETYLNTIDRNILELKRLYEKCLLANIKLPNNFIENYDGKIYASKYLHQYIIKDIDNKKIINEQAFNDSNVFYREYMSNPKTLFYVDMDDVLPNFEKACEIVHKAGGLVFLPHIFEYRENSENILNEILNNNIQKNNLNNIDGIECYYRNFTDKQKKYLLNICNEKKLFISGGSDYHGRVKPNVKMGIGEGYMNVPDHIIEKWKIVI